MPRTSSRTRSGRLSRGPRAALTPGRPLGYYIMNAQECRELLCEELFSNQTRPCDEQRCDYQLYSGQYMTQAILGATDHDVPKACAKSTYGNSSEHTAQDSWFCSGYCPEGYYCPDDATQDPLPCPPGHWCGLGTVTPSPCEEGTYADGAPVNRSSILACKQCPAHATTTCEGTGCVASGASSIEQCVCKQDYYAKAVPDLGEFLTCKACPSDVGESCAHPNTTENDLQYDCPWEHGTSGHFWLTECKDGTYCNEIL